MMGGGIYGVVKRARHHTTWSSGSGFASERGAWSRTERRWDQGSGMAAGRAGQRPEFGSADWVGFGHQCAGGCGGIVSAVAMVTVAGFVVVSFERGVVGS